MPAVVVLFDEEAIMQLTVDLPEDVLQHLAPDPRRCVFEAVVVDAYRRERISTGRLGELLGLDRWQAEEFLDLRGARLPYTPEMLQEDRRAVEERNRPR